MNNAKGREGLAVRATYTYDEDTAQYLDEIYIYHYRNSDKRTRSSLVAEAIKLLWDKRNEERCR